MNRQNQDQIVHYRSGIDNLDDLYFKQLNKGLSVQQQKEILIG